MKHLTLILLFLSTISNCIKAQDIITKTDNTEIKAKILEISTTELRYKKFDYLEGPTIILPTKEIKNIKYPNGSIENYNNSSATSIKKENAETSESKTTTVQDGFTNKDEAKNQLVNGLREGKWIIYYNNDESRWKETKKETATFYGLVVCDHNNFSGMHRTYDIKGNLVKETLYKNGYAEIKEKYLENESKYSVKNGLLHGDFTVYRPNGHLLMEGKYINGVEYGERKFYGENGNLLSNEIIQNDTTHFIVNDVNIEKIGKNGLIKEYNPNGNILSEAIYSNGKIVGIEKQYHSDGTIASSTTYNDGKRSGIEIKYHSDGEIWQETFWSNNQPTLIKSYYKGSLQSESPIFNGKPEGISKTYDENGILVLETPYTKGKINGIVKTYLKGQLSFETPYANDKKNGIAILYYPNGSIMSQTKYVDDIKDLEFEKEQEKIKKKDARQKGIKEFGTAALQLLQQTQAQIDFTKNPNSQNFNKYLNVTTNNYTKSPEEAIKANNEVLTGPINNTAESSASTNGGNSSNPRQAAICAQLSAKEWENSTAYKNYYKKNPACSKLAYIAQREQAVILLKNCEQYSSPEDLEALNKTISTLTSQIDSMPDCESFRFDDPGKIQKPNITIVPSTPPQNNNNNGSGAVKAQ